MKISKVRVRKFENAGSVVKGLAELTFNNCFVIKDIRLIEKPEKMVVQMPSKTLIGKDEMGLAERKHKDLAHPINQETREIINNAILSTFDRSPVGDYEEDVDILVCED